MTLTSPHRSRERILLFSVGGAGKTYAALQCLRDALPEGQTGWYIETDPTLDRMLEDPEFEELKVHQEYYDGRTDRTYCTDTGQLVVYHCTNWIAVREAIADVWDRAERDDWIIVDNISLPWDWVQTHYWQQVHGVELDDFLLQIRRDQLANDNTSGKANEGKFNEWSFINPHFSKHFTEKLVNPPCHLIMTAQQADYVGQFDDKNKETSGLYSRYGVKVKGQKQSGHLSHTVLWLTKTKSGDHKLTTIKDRGGRFEFDKEGWEDFPAEYLVEVAGWMETEASLSSQATTTSRSSVPKAKPKPKPKAKPL